MNVSRKILAPTLAPTILYREQPSRALEEAMSSSNGGGISFFHHLVLLCAPAGYGKTTLLADTVKRLPLTCCWYFLDRSDLDRVIFLETLLASICQQFPGFESQLDAILVQSIEQDETSFLTQLDALIKVLSTDLPKPCLLALCNYQEVNDSKEINDIINYLLKHLPPQCLLVIESRSVPDLELAPLIAGRKVFEIGSKSLQFSIQDLYSLAQAQHLPAFTEEEATELVNAFDGWITGILLSSRLGSTHFEVFTSTSINNWVAPTIYANRQQLFAFVVKEIFRNEAMIYNFLKDTSLLDQINPTFCNALLQISNAATLLEYAERQGLFVMHINEIGEPTYICHPALRELFREELRRHNNARYRTLHQQIATHFYQMHAYETAMNHALEAEQYDFVTHILIEATPTLLNQGQSETVLHCLDSLPPRIAQTDPQLLLIWVNTYLRRGDFTNAQLFLDHAEKQVTSSSLANESLENVIIFAELAIVSGKLLLSQGKHQLAQKQFQHAQELLPLDERVLRIRTYQQIGICIILRGEPIYEGILQFQHALKLCHPHRDAYQTGELYHQLANAYEWTGNYTIAQHYRRRISAIQDRLDHPNSIINNLIGMGLLKMYQGFVAEAETFFHDVLNLTQQSSRSISSKAYALLGLGELELTRQYFKQALTYLEEALDLAQQLEDRYLLNSTLNTLTLVYLRMEDIQTAQCLLSQTLLHTNETQSYESIAYKLAKGTLLLAQQHYDEAKTELEEVTRLTDKAGMQRLHIQALMRLAACFLAQHQRPQAKNALQLATDLNTKGKHNYCIQIELQAYPAILPLTEKMKEQDNLPGIKVLPTARLCVYALGEPIVAIDTIPVTRWRMARAMELYFFLLEKGQPLHKDRIIAALWPETDDAERINQTFRSTIYYLRQVIGDTCLIQRSGLYQLDLNATYGQFWYDVTTFEEQLRIARIALEEENDESAAGAFQKMVDLYRGDYVQAIYSDWCIPRRDELRKAFIEAYRQLALIAWRREAWDESIVYWQHLLTLDTCLETAHYGIMRCYLRQGKRDMALKQYQLCSKELHEQMKIKPGPTLQKLYQRLTNASH